MRQNILFVILLLGAFLIGKESFGGINSQVSETAPVLTQETKQETEPTAPAPAPRIKYREVISKLSDSIVFLNQTMEEVNLRLEKITLEKESLNIAFLEATGSIDEKGIGREERPSGWQNSIWLTLLLAVMIIVMAFLLFACKAACNKSRQKALQYDELFEEFESYRKSSRERFEKQAIDHFKELKKLNKI